MDNIQILHDLSASDVLCFQDKRIIAVDCEMAGLNPYRDPLYIIQIGDRDNNIRVIKTNEWKNAVHLREVLIDEKIIKVFHFAIMDCGFILSNMGVSVANVYCTKIASKIARTYSSSHSLSTIVEELFEVKLNKKLQNSFWGSDKFNDDQLTYISADVHYLLEIKNKLEAIMDLKGLLPTGISYRQFNQDCQQMIPALVHAWVNGWDFGKENPELIFGR